MAPENRPKLPHKETSSTPTIHIRGEVLVVLVLGRAHVEEHGDDFGVVDQKGIMYSMVKVDGDRHSQVRWRFVEGPWC